MVGSPDLFTEILKRATELSVVLTLGSVAAATVGAKTLIRLSRRAHGTAIKVPDGSGRISVPNYSSEEQLAELEAAIARARGSKTPDQPSAKAYKTRDAASPWLVARARVVVRISEAARSRAERSNTQKWSAIAANLLTIAQYIIGGVLASSFVQESLTPKWVGALGVLVLIASLFKQQFHPEINAEDARRKASKLQGLIRSSEDQLAILDAKSAAGQDHSDAMIALLTQITQRLTEIENPEAIELRPQLLTN